MLFFLPLLPPKNTGRRKREIKRISSDLIFFHFSQLFLKRKGQSHKGDLQLVKMLMCKVLTLTLTPCTLGSSMLTWFGYIMRFFLGQDNCVSNRTLLISTHVLLSVVFGNADD